jgi:hypothetical protein
MPAGDQEGFRADESPTSGESAGRAVHSYDTGQFELGDLGHLPSVATEKRPLIDRIHLRTVVPDSVRKLFLFNDAFGLCSADHFR